MKKEVFPTEKIEDKLEGKDVFLLDKKIDLIKSLSESDELRIKYQKEIGVDLGKKLELENCSGDISLADGFSLAEILEKEAREIDDRKKKLIDAYDPRLDRLDDIVLNLRLCQEIVTELCGPDTPLSVRYDDSDRDSYFSPEEKTIYIPRKIIIDKDKRQAIKKLIHEIGHFTDFNKLSADKENIVSFLRPTYVAFTHNVYEKDEKKRAEQVQSLFPKKDSESEEEWFTRLKKYCTDEKKPDSDILKICENYIKAKIMASFSFAQYANDPFELSADEFAREQAGVFTGEKITKIIETQHDIFRSSCEVEGFAENSPITGVQKELAARVKDRSEFLLVRLQDDADRLLAKNQNKKMDVITHLLKKVSIFTSLNSKIYDSYDSGLNDIAISESGWQSIADELCRQENLEPIKVKISDDAGASCYRFQNNTINLSSFVMREVGNRGAMREFAHEFKHAADLQGLAGGEKTARYLDSMVYSMFKKRLAEGLLARENEIRSLMQKNQSIGASAEPEDFFEICRNMDLKSLPAEGKLRKAVEDYLEKKLLFELLNLKYRRDYYEMKAEKFSLSAAKSLTNPAIKRVLSGEPLS